MGNHVRGMIGARKAFKAIAPEIQAQLNEATEKTVFAVKQRAISGVPVDTGNLRDHIDSRFSARSGFGAVGIRPGRVAVAGRGGSALTSHGARVMDAKKYGPLVHNGTSRIAGRPFMLQAAEGERSGYAQRLRVAGKKAEQNLAGGRFL